MAAALSFFGMVGDTNLEGGISIHPGSFDLRVQGVRNALRYFSRSRFNWESQGDSERNG